MSNFWDKQDTIGSVKKNKREEIVVCKCERNNNEYVDVRINAISDDNKHIPTSKGFSLKKEKFKELIEILETM